MDIGLTYYEIEKILKDHFNENADILIGIDDPEMNQLVEVLLQSVVEVIDRNNKEIHRRLEDAIQALEYRKKITSL